MAKASKTIETMEQGVKCGGVKAFERAFEGGEPLDRWREFGVPACERLSSLLGLQMRGYTPASKLFGCEHWTDLPGVALARK